MHENALPEATGKILVHSQIEERGGKTYLNLLFSMASSKAVNATRYLIPIKSNQLPAFKIPAND